MKRSYFLILIIGILFITLVVIDEQKFHIHEDTQKGSLHTHQFNGSSYVHINELTKRTPIKSKVDTMNRTIVLQDKDHTFSLISEVPVVNHNGIYEGLEYSPLVKDEDAWLPFSFYKHLLEMEEQFSVFNYEKEEKPSKKMKAEEMAHYLSFVQSPIEGAHVSTVDSSLPGAARGYRNGFHEGLDWYSYVCGITINEKTKVTSVADGTVIRVDHQYKELSLKERQSILKIAGTESKTPEYILDKLRGRSVWVQHKKGLLCRYVHLSSVNHNLKVGDHIRAGDFIGNVGNSGTSEGVANKKEGLHLHLDILLYGEWFWSQYSVKERRQILEKIFNPKVC